MQNHSDAGGWENYAPSPTADVLHLQNHSDAGGWENYAPSPTADVLHLI